MSGKNPIFAQMRLKKEREEQLKKAREGKDDGLGTPESVGAKPKPPPEEEKVNEEQKSKRDARKKELEKLPDAEVYKIYTEHFGQKKGVARKTMINQILKKEL